MDLSGAMPLVVAVFIITAAWPIKPWLDQMLPPSLSYLGTILALFMILACFIAIIYFAIAEVTHTFGDNQEQFRVSTKPMPAGREKKASPFLAARADMTASSPLLKSCSGASMHCSAISASSLSW